MIDTAAAAPQANVRATSRTSTLRIDASDPRFRATRHSEREEEMAPLAFESSLQIVTAIHSELWVWQISQADSTASQGDAQRQLKQLFRAATDRLQDQRRGQWRTAGFRRWRPIRASLAISTTSASFLSSTCARSRRLPGVAATSTIATRRTSW